LLLNILIIQLRYYKYLLIDMNVLGTESCPQHVVPIFLHALRITSVCS